MAIGNVHGRVKLQNRLKPISRRHSQQWECEFKQTLKNKKKRKFSYFSVSQTVAEKRLQRVSVSTKMDSCVVSFIQSFAIPESSKEPLKFDRTL